MFLHRLRLCHTLVIIAQLLGTQVKNTTKASSHRNPSSIYSPLHLQPERRLLRPGAAPAEESRAGDSYLYRGHPWLIHANACIFEYVTSFRISSSVSASSQSSSSSSQSSSSSSRSTPDRSSCRSRLRQRERGIAQTRSQSEPTTPRPLQGERHRPSAPKHQQPETHRRFLRFRRRPRPRPIAPCGTR